MSSELLFSLNKSLIDVYKVIKLWLSIVETVIVELFHYSIL